MLLVQMILRSRPCEGSELQLHWQTWNELAGEVGRPYIQPAAFAGAQTYDETCISDMLLKLTCFWVSIEQGGGKAGGKGREENSKTTKGKEMEMEQETQKTMPLQMIQEKLRVD